MFSGKYRIQMQTPLGIRPGMLEMQIEKDRIIGSLEVLRHLEPFEGRIDEDGNCRIKGRLVTLISSIPYTAAGRITPESLRLSLKGGGNQFQITGTICQENGADQSAEAEKESACL